MTVFNLLVFYQALGTYEFGEGSRGMNSLFQATTSAMQKMNTHEPKHFLRNIGWNVFTYSNGEHVINLGFITYHIQDLSNISLTSFKFKDDLTAVCQKAQMLKSRSTGEMLIIIGVGYTTFDINKKLANECNAIDVIIDGFTDTFLYNGVKPSSEEPQGEYPLVFTQPTTKKRIPILQIPQGTKYMGYLRLDLDSEEGLVSWGGNPILLDSSIVQDKKMIDLIKKFKKDRENIHNFVLGKSKVLLQGQKCTKFECNLGNIVADAVIYDRSNQFKGIHWTDAPIALINGGAFITDIKPEPPHFNITYGDILKAMKRNPLVLLTLTGSEIYKILERSVGNSDNLNMEYLHVSGLKVIVDKNKPKGERVVSVNARCGYCLVPVFQPVDFEESYRIITTEFLALGEAGFKVLRDKDRSIIKLGVYDTSCLAMYIQNLNIIYPAEEQRIMFVKKHFL